MPDAQPNRAWSCLGLLVACAMCILAASGAAVLLVMPRSATLGPPDPSLEPLPRGLLATYLGLRSEALNQPAGTATARVDVEVLSGESAASVVQRLEDLGIVRNTILLRAYLRYLGIDRSIQAGHYTLSGNMTLREVAQALQTASQPTIVITVPEGWRSEQIAELLTERGTPFSGEDFLEATHLAVYSPTLLAELPDPARLEGFLFPDTYYMTPQSQPEQLVAAMLDAFEKRVDAELRAGFARQGLSLYQAVTLASIVEREAVVAEERPRIASVFLNRLAIDMTLDADPTVQYALGRQPDRAWWKTGLTEQDLRIESPYNTYLHAGLPPAPIANPGLESLRAVAFPEETTYLYFRAACDGSGRHTFAGTFEQHLQNACP